MSERRVYRILRAAKRLNKENSLELQELMESLSSEGLSADEIGEAVRLVFGPLGLLQQYQTDDPFYEQSTRVLGTREKRILSLEAQGFLLNALQTRMVQAMELEQIMIMVSSWQNVDVQGAQVIMAQVISDEALSRLLVLPNDQYVH